MAMTQRDIKILWSRSGGRCAFANCRRELTQDVQAGDPATIGVQAHIVGNNPGSARSASNLTDDERDTYSNTILLCPTDHTTIDNDPGTYTVERLHLIKDQHEEWVRSSLARPDERDQIAGEQYATFIDAAASAFNMEHWDQWTHAAFDAVPQWWVRRIDAVEDFNRRINRAVWPGTRQELERAIRTLALAGQNAAQVFLEHAELVDGDQLVDQERWRAVHFDEDAEDEFNEWTDRNEHAVKEMCKAANWFADLVRRDVNPRFMLVGRFALTWTDGNFNLMGNVFEYTEDEKAALPGAFQAEPEND